MMVRYNFYFVKITHHESFLARVHIFICVALTFLSSATENPQQWLNIAHDATFVGDIQCALKYYKQVLAVEPNNTSILHNIGYVHKLAGDPWTAQTFYKRALELNPSLDATRFGLAMAYLKAGDYINGWREYEHDLIKKGKNAPLLRAQLRAGKNLDNFRIILIPEGGLGDSIQFIRYARELKKLGAHVIVYAQKPLIPLFSLVDSIDELYSMGSEIVPYNDATSLMSIPAILHELLQHIPVEIPYLKPSAEREEYWKQQFAGDHSFNIGICWCPSVANEWDKSPVHKRSIPLNLLASLSTIENVKLYSLQQYDGLDELSTLDPQYKVILFDENFDKIAGAFMDSAAVIQQLDLVISIDSAIMHLSGALGVPTFLLLPLGSDWRWIAGRTDSPWYPTLKIVAQSTPCNWLPVMNAVAQEVTQLSQQKQREISTS